MAEYLRGDCTILRSGLDSRKRGIGIGAGSYNMQSNK